MRLSKGYHVKASDHVTCRFVGSLPTERGNDHVHHSQLAELTPSPSPSPSPSHPPPKHSQSIRHKTISTWRRQLPEPRPKTPNSPSAHAPPISPHKFSILTPKTP
jgi:hypothetical protein